MIENNFKIGDYIKFKRTDISGVVYNIELDIITMIGDNGSMLSTYYDDFEMDYERIREEKLKKILDGLS